jgi:hypothetical protein
MKKGALTTISYDGNSKVDTPIISNSPANTAHHISSSEDFRDSKINVVASF